MGLNDDLDEMQRLARSPGQKDREQLLAKIFQRYRERLKSMVRLRLDQRLQGRIDPSDVIQETYFEAAKRLEEYLHDPAVPIFIWLRFLAGQKLQELHHHHLKLQRRDARREVALYHGPLPEASSEAIAARLIGEGPTPSERVMKAEKLEQIVEALNRMDRLDREVIALRHFEQLTGRETAKVLGIQERAASKRYIRALKRLKEILGARSKDQEE